MQNCGWGWKPGGEEQADGLVAEEGADGLAVELEGADVLAGVEEGPDGLAGVVLLGVDECDTEGDEELLTGFSSSSDSAEVSSPLFAI